MNKLFTGVVVAVIACVGIITPALAKDKDTVALGGLDLNGYCSATGQGPDASPSKKALTKDWTCSTTGTGKDINLRKACTWQYGETADNVKEVVAGDVYTYVCFN